MKDSDYDKKRNKSAKRKYPDHNGDIPLDNMQSPLLPNGYPPLGNGPTNYARPMPRLNPRKVQSVWFTKRNGASGKANPAKLKDLMQRSDRDRDGKLSRIEATKVCKVFAQKAGIPESEAFEYIDSDGDGYLNLDEVNNALLASWLISSNDAVMFDLADFPEIDKRLPEIHSPYPAYKPSHPPLHDIPIDPREQIAYFRRMADDLEQSTLLGEDDRKTNSSVAFSIVNIDDVTEPCVSQKQILLIMLFFFVALGTTWFVLHEGCTFIDGLYLVIIIGTTVGYGLDDFMEDTTNQVFLIFYIIFGVALITATLNVLFVGMLDGMQKKSVKFFDAGDEDCFTETTITEEGGENFLQRCLGDGAYNSLLNFVQSRTFELGMWLIWLFGGSFLMGSYEGWQPLICIYFAIVSGSTVGFGDFAPESQEGKMVCIIWLPISIALTANVFASIFSSILNSFYDESMAELADFRNMCEDLLNVENFVENFEKMDIDGDGELTEAEFITQALINDYGVPPKKLQVLKQYFNELDVDGGGSITIEDFKARINQVHENIKSGYEQGQPKQTAI